MPKLIMGKMQLEGSEVKLKKPFAVTNLIPGSEEGGAPEYHVVGVIRQKMVFKTRPVPASRPELPQKPQPALCGTKRARAATPDKADSSAVPLEPTAGQ